MEVLETARDNLDAEEAEVEAGVIRNEDDDKSSEHGASDVDDSSTDDDDDNDNNDVESNRRRPVSGHANENGGDNSYNKDSNDNNKDSEGLIEHYRSRRRDQKVEHRRHRGVMQFKIPRTALWAKHKGERVQDKLESIFKHHTRDPGIETEV